jgi:aldehyde dehydrogenase (NAD+)
MGPVISRKQLDRVMSYVEIGKTEGARLLAGGKVRTDKGGGFFVEPTCFIDVRNDMRIAREEIFGPVLAIIPYEDDEDAIRIANDSEYGLGGAVFGGDKERTLRVAKRVRASAISVNGREWGREGIEEFLETKAIGARV